MPVQFGAVKIVLQSQALKPQQEYAEKAEAIRQRLRGNLEVLGPDPELQETIENELGAPAYDTQALYEAANRKFDSYLGSLEEGKQPDYRALLFQLGQLANPLEPSQKALQKLLIDGEDVARFEKEVFDEAFFQEATYPNGSLQIQTTRTHHSTDPYPGKGMENAMRRVIDRFAKEARSEGSVLDLDA